jgi:hypothetical protein
MIYNKRTSLTTSTGMSLANSGSERPKCPVKEPYLALLALHTDGNSDSTESIPFNSRKDQVKGSALK